MLGLYGPNALHKPDAFSITVREISSGTLEIEGWPFEFVHLPPRQNHGVAFTYQGQRYAFAGDSHFHEEEVAFVSGAELAVIDAGHQSGEEIVELASRAQPRMLVLSHLYDEPAADSLTARAQERGFEGKIIVGQDLMSFSLD
jgi:ribonuclease BN (tRNA processing enzyme)